MTDYALLVDVQNMLGGMWGPDIAQGNGSEVLLFPRHGHIHDEEGAPYQVDEKDRPVLDQHGNRVPTQVERVKDNPTQRQFGSMPYWL